MPDGKLNLYNIGTLGVNVDKNAIQLEDGELPKAQNAVLDLAGSEGGLRKRPGLTKVNASAAAGSIGGAIGVPIGLGTAGNDGGVTPSPAVQPANRKFLVGRRITSTTAGWNVSTDNFTTASTSGGPDGYDAAATPRVPDYVWSYLATQSVFQKQFGGRAGVMFKNRLYYAGNDYTVAVTPPTIRMYDGTTDYYLNAIPFTSSPAFTPTAVLCMILGGDGYIYFTVQDNGSYAANTVKIKVFQLDPENGGVLQIGQIFPISPETARVPYALAWHMGRLWTATFTGGSSASQRSYFIRPNADTSWTQDSASVGANGPFPSMLSFQGKLYLGCMGTGGSPALVMVRNIDGTYSTSKTVVINEGSGTVITAFRDWNSFGAMAIFGGNLYASYYDGDAADQWSRIYKFDGTTWSMVFSSGHNDADAIPYCNAVVIGGAIYFISAPSDGNANKNRILKSTNGSSWTSITTSILTGDTTSVFGAIAS